MRVLQILNHKLEEYILVVSVSLLVIIVVLQVFFRFVINMSFGWSEELARYLLIWIAWIAASFAVQRNAHIRVEIVKNMFGDSIKKVIELIVLVISLAFATILAVEGTKFMLLVKGTHQVSPSLGLGMWIVYLGVPVGATLMAIRFMQELIKIVKPKAEKH